MTVDSSKKKNQGDKKESSFADCHLIELSRLDTPGQTDTAHGWVTHFPEKKLFFIYVCKESESESLKFGRLRSPGSCYLHVHNTHLWQYEEKACLEPPGKKAFNLRNDCLSRPPCRPLEDAFGMRPGCCGKNSNHIPNRVRDAIQPWPAAARRAIPVPLRRCATAASPIFREEAPRGGWSVDSAPATLPRSCGGFAATPAARLDLRDSARSRQPRRSHPQSYVQRTGPAAGVVPFPLPYH